MRFRKYVFIALLFSAGDVAAQTPAPTPDLYKASAIPDSLKENAYAVVRYCSREMVVKSPGKSTEKVRRIVTILDEKAEDEATLVRSYDRKFNSINSIEMIAYDAAGNQLKKYRKSDMYDRSAVDGISIITDSRILAISHDVASYPITIETSYEEESNSFLDLSSWTIQESDYAVQNEYMQISANPAVGFRYKNSNTSLKPVKKTVGELEVYQWEVHNLKAGKEEEDVPSWKVVPKISFATNLFEYDGKPGNISTWNNFGLWLQALNADVGKLTPQREAEIKQMTAALPNDKAKAKFLYEYMQKNVRYVSIQLGIGGLKPFPATFVDEKKYGDCKALSNYMKALLNAVGIPSYYTVINAGENAEPADPAFPSDPFNHIILCIPFKSDTTWLECTSNTKPFGKLGTFTENRRGLLVTETGGKLVNTPKSNMQDNQFLSEVVIDLDGAGGAIANMKIDATGEYRSMYLSLAEEKVDDQKTYLIRSLNLKQPSFMELKHVEDKDGSKKMDISLEYNKFSDVMTGDKQFYKPQVLDIWRLSLPPVEKRVSDFYFEHPLMKTCTTLINLPAGFVAETVPVNISTKFTYGTYDATYAYDAEKNQVKVVNKFMLTAHVIPAAKYTEMQQFMEAVAKAQNKKLVIRKKT